jgi:hypothetical protein
MFHLSDSVFFCRVTNYICGTVVFTSLPLNVTCASLNIADPTGGSESIDLVLAASSILGHLSQPIG